LRVDGKIKRNEENSRLLLPKSVPLDIIIIIIIIIAVDVLILQCVPFIVSPSTASSSHRKSAFASVSRKSCAQERAKDILYVAVSPQVFQFIACTLSGAVTIAKCPSGAAMYNVNQQ
jgi:hypothetical protein